MCFWRQQAWLATDPTTGLERPPAPLDRARALTREQIASLWRRQEVALRERALWRLRSQFALSRQPGDTALDLGGHGRSATHRVAHGATTQPATQQAVPGNDLHCPAQAHAQAMAVAGRTIGRREPRCPFRLSQTTKSHASVDLYV